KPKKNFGPPWPIYGRVETRTRDASDLTSVKPPFGGVWDMKQHALLEFPPSYANGVLYLGRDDGWVLAINLYTRKVLWRHRFPPVPDQPALWHNLVIFGTFDQPGSVVAVNKDTGKVRWRRRLTDQVESSMVVSDGKVFTGCNDGMVRALSARTGRVVWSYRA